MSVIVDGIPDAAILLGPLLHFFADETIEDGNSALQGIHTVCDCLVVLGAFSLLRLQELLHAAPALSFSDQGLLVGIVMLLP